MQYYVEHWHFKWLNIWDDDLQQVLKALRPESWNGLNFKDLTSSDSVWEINKG